MKKFLYCILYATFFCIDGSIHDQLLIAVKLDKINEVKRLLRAGANPNGARCEVIVDREKHKCEWDLSHWDDPAYTKPWVEPAYISTRIKGTILDATCLFCALDNRNIEMARVLVFNNADISALITFEGQEIIEDKSDPQNPKIAIRNHTITQIAGILHETLGQLIGLEYADPQKLSFNRVLST